MSLALALSTQRILRISKSFSPIAIVTPSSLYQWLVALRLGAVVFFSSSRRRSCQQGNSTTTLHRRGSGDSWPGAGMAGIAILAVACSPLRNRCCLLSTTLGE